VILVSASQRCFHLLTAVAIYKKTEPILQSIYKTSHPSERLIQTLKTKHVVDLLNKTSEFVRSKILKHKSSVNMHFNDGGNPLRGAMTLIAV